MDQMQQYLEKVQAKAASIRKTTIARKAFDDTFSLLVYAVGSLLTLLGSVLKLFFSA
jgi:hypothetical protein